MSVTLVFPPHVDPRAPYLAIPALAAYLRNRGVVVDVVDANLDLFDRTVSVEGLKSLDSKVTGSALRYLLDNVEAAKSNLRKRETFFDYPLYSRSRNVIELALRVLSQVHGGSRLSIRDSHNSGEALDEVLMRVGSCAVSVYGDAIAHDIVPRIIAKNPQFVGISVANFGQLEYGLRIATMLKKLGVFVVVGGATITLMRREIKLYSQFLDFADLYVLYEGEAALATLLGNLSSGTATFEGVPSCIYRVNGLPRVQHTPHVGDLDQLPTPDFSGMPLDRYLAPDRVLPLIGSKGCSWGRCTFCSIPTTSGARGGYRYRAAALVAEDLRLLRERFSARHFMFVDENISADRLQDMSVEICKRRLSDVRWMAFSRFERGHTTNRLKQNYEAGLRKLLMGLESANPLTLKAMKKGISLRVVQENIEALHQARVPINMFCMVGFPGESEKEADDTVKFVGQRLDQFVRPGFSCSFSAFNLDPESPLGKNGEGPDQQITMDEADRASLAAHCNRRIRDLLLPYEMIGWEEYSLLYIERQAPQMLRIVDALANERETSKTVACERKLRARAYVYCLTAGSPTTLVNPETGAFIIASRGVTRLLDQLVVSKSWDDFVRSISSHEGIRERNHLADVVRILERYGFLEFNQPATH